jgi:general secretion pathway protein J
MKARGFTLLELVVVIAVFGVFASMAYGGLNYVLKARRQVETALNRTAEWQKAFNRMRNDFELASTRGARDGFGEPKAALVFDEYGPRVELTRAGWRNPLLAPRASLERVVWRYDDKQKRLLRETWRDLDRASDTDPAQLVVLENLKDVKWRFLDASREWQPRWPAQAVAAGTDVPLPKAMEVTFTSADFGSVRWLFRPGVSPIPANGGINNSNGNNTKLPPCTLPDQKNCTPAASTP